jgi:hypothetical protein
MLCKLKLMTILVCLVAFVLPASIAAQNQTTKQEQHAAEIRSKTKQFGPSDKVTVKLDDGTSYSGTVRSANDNDFVVLDGSGTPRTIRYADVHSIGKDGGGPKIGIVIALAAVGTAAIIFAIFKASGKRL